MVSPICVHVLAALLLWNISLMPCERVNGVRSDGHAHGQNGTGLEGTVLEGPKTYTIDLVVTRHGLSCSNIFSDFPSSSQGSQLSKLAQGWSELGGHKNIADPILAQAGMQGSLDMRSITTDFKPDAVLTSPLLRAIETAILQYPSDTLHIVPWIREASKMSEGYKQYVPKLGGEGADNLPTLLPDQKKRLKKELSDLQGMMGIRSTDNILFKDWTTDGNRMEKHDWTKFKEFLAKEFLPFLIPQLNRSLGGTITLAVVTHSNFMKSEDDINGKCGHHWAAAPGKKPLNNQAVRISYDAEPEIIITSPASEDRVRSELQGGFVLTQQEGCSVVAGGLPYKGRKLCLQDIGESCQKDIQEQKLSLPDLVETPLIRELVQKSQEKIKKLQEMENQANQEEWFQAHVKPLQDEIQALQGKIRTKKTTCITHL